jgi:hypothetical protein
MRRFVIAAGAIMAISGVAASGAGAAPNPAGTGQPGTVAGTACFQGNAMNAPPGIASLNDGFNRVALSNYANFNKPAAAPAAGKAASEYDVACFQFTSNH